MTLLSFSVKTNRQAQGQKACWIQDQRRGCGETANPIYSSDVTGHPREWGCLDINSTVLTQAVSSGLKREYNVAFLFHIILDVCGKLIHDVT